MDLCSVLAQAVRQGDMPDDDHKAEPAALFKPGGQFLFGFDQVLVGLETEPFSRCKEQAFIVGSPAFDIHAGVSFRQLIRLDILPGDSHPLQHMAQCENGTAGFLQRTVMLL